MRWIRSYPVLAILLLGLSAAWLAHQTMHAINLAHLRLMANSQLRLRGSLLTRDIANYRLLPTVLSEDRDVIDAHDSWSDRRLSSRLEALERETGVSSIYVIAGDGRTIAAGNWRTADSFIGNNYAWRQYFIDARRSGSGEQFALGSISHRPGLFISHRAPNGLVVVVKLEFGWIETQWRNAGGISFVTDDDGVILISSEPRWRFAMTHPLSPEQSVTIRKMTGVIALRPKPYREKASGTIMPLSSHQNYVLASSPSDIPGWHLQIAMPTQSGGEIMNVMAGVVAALSVWVLAALIWLEFNHSYEQREHTAELEAAVAARTFELTRQVEERAAIEERVAELREGLRQANRLALLGQITSSVAHETAQPVAAIRARIASTHKLLERGNKDDISANLDAIDQLAERISLVTAELRDFSRKGRRDLGPVPLSCIIEGSRLLLKERLAQVRFIEPRVSPKLMVFGERICLEQALVNLMQNALDALHDVPEPKLEIRLATARKSVSLSVADNGPGVAAEIVERLFTPFVTSRVEGLGLGLAIVQDIMLDCGGSLRLAENEGGALFVLRMQRV